MMVLLRANFSSWSFCRASAGPWASSSPVSGFDQHEAAAVGVDGAEDQFQDAVEQLVQVEDLADRLAGLVHDGQVGQGVLEPGGRPVRSG